MNFFKFDVIVLKDNLGYITGRVISIDLCVKKVLSSRLFIVPKAHNLNEVSGPQSVIVSFTISRFTIHNHIHSIERTKYLIPNAY